MKRIQTVIIGGGQAGLAMSRCLAERGVDRVVLERGRVGERWLSERWDSLRLLTPNWQSRLPGFHYDGPDPEGFMTAGEVAAHLRRYADSFDARVQSGTTVHAVESSRGRYRVTTDRGTWDAANVVIATGHCDQPSMPPFSAHLSPEIVQVVPSKYRRPADLPHGGVLVVGASSTGAQLAEEIHASGRPVTLAVGRHTRMPRRYRGHDILAWLDRMGVFDETTEEVFNIEASRRQPSLQLVGSPDHRSLDLGDLQERGVKLSGRLIGAEGFYVRFADDLVETTAAAQARLARILERVDRYLEASGFMGPVAEPTLPAPIVAAPHPMEIDLRRAGIRTVLWATGYRRTYPWLKVPVLDRRGEIQHRGGITPAPGLYALGLFFMRRRKSSFLDGVGDDAEFLVDQIAGRMTSSTRKVA